MHVMVSADRPGFPPLARVFYCIKTSFFYEFFKTTYAYKVRV